MIPAPILRVTAQSKAAKEDIDHVVSRLKNRTDPAENPEIRTLKSIIDLNKETPDGLKLNGPRDLLEKKGEGKPVTVTGFIIHAEESGTEACNCFFDDSLDIHFNLVQTKTTKAEKNITDKKKLLKSRKNRSVVAELTPRIRPDGWTEEKLKKLVKELKFVKVTGWLMFDSRHTKLTESSPRATAWEVHPVTEFEICDGSKAECDNGQKWEKLENFTP